MPKCGLMPMPEKANSVRLVCPVSAAPAARSRATAGASAGVQIVCAALLEPGDAIFIPSMWWHHVEALAPLNLLVNHWWRDAPAHMDSPMNALMHALLSVRDLPPAQRQAWAGLFHHYWVGDNTLKRMLPGSRR